MIPIFLEGYDLFGNLKAWKSSGTPDERRAWEVKSWNKNIIMCRLTWSLKGQCAGIDKAAGSAQEAVWLAIEEFKRVQS